MRDGANQGRERRGDDDRPYLSIVMCSRNDDYAGSMVDRLQASLDVLLGQLAAYRLSAEIIIVEWNPPPDRPFLDACMRLGGLPEQVTVRFVRVPESVHRRYALADRIPMNVAAANNVGLRRARGRFAVARASDAYFSNELVRRLAQRDLDPGAVYRCLRVDVQAPARQEGAGWREVLQRLESAPVLRVCEHLAPPTYPPVLPLYTNASGDFLLASPESWQRVHGFPEGRFACAVDHDGLALHALVASGRREAVLPPECRLLKPAHTRHTVDKLRALPVPERVVAFTEDLVHATHAMFVERGHPAPEHWSDAVRFWVFLLLGYPHRELAGLGELPHPTYHEYLYRALVLDNRTRRDRARDRCENGNEDGEGRSAGIPVALRKAIAAEILRHAARHFRAALAAPGKRAAASRLLRLAAFSLRRPVYSMNTYDWGCGALALHDQVLSGVGAGTGFAGATAASRASTHPSSGAAAGSEASRAASRRQAAPAAAKATNSTEDCT